MRTASYQTAALIKGTMKCPLTEPWPGYRRQHTEGSPAASAPWPTDLKHSTSNMRKTEKNPLIGVNILSRVKRGCRLPNCSLASATLGLRRKRLPQGKKSLTISWLACYLIYTSVSWYGAKQRNECVLC